MKTPKSTEDLFQTLDKIQSDAKVHMQHIASGTTTVNVTASGIDLSDQMEALNQTILERIEVDRNEGDAEKKLIKK